MRRYHLLIVALFAAVSSYGQNKKIAIAPDLTAQIKHEPGKPVVQVLMPGVDMMELDLNQPIAETYQIKTADYNFDGQKDFAFVAVNQTSGIQTYDIFLYRPEEKTFEALEVPGGICERFSNVRLNVNEKSLRSSCKAGAKSSLDTYVWKNAFELVHTGSTDHSLEAQEESKEQTAEEKADKADERKAAKEEREEKKASKKESKDDDE